MRITRAIKPGYSGAVVVCFVALITAGCLALRSQTAKSLAPQPAAERDAPTVTADSTPPKARTGSPNASPAVSHERDSRARLKDAKHPADFAEVVGRQDFYSERKRKTGYLTGLTGPADSSESSEEQRAMSVARELARKLPRIRKIKLCRDLEEEDWWICLYEERGPYLELQQYTWNAYQDRPQPFLVLERIAKSGLQKHLTEVTPGMKCQVLDPPAPQSWLAQIQEARRSPANRAAPLARAAAEKERGEHFRTAKSVIKTPNRPHDRSKGSVAQRSGVVGSWPAKRPQDNDMKSPPTARRESATKSAADKSRPPDPRIAKEKAERSGTTRHADSPAKNRLLPRIALESDRDPQFRHAYAPPQPSGKSLVSSPKSSQPSFKAASAPRYPRNLSSISKTQPHSSVVTTPSGRPTCFVFAYGSKMNHMDLLAWLDANGYDSSMVVSVEPGVVLGYDLVWNFYSTSRGGGAVNVEPRKGSRVWGLLIEIEDPLLRAFDEREGHPNVYSRGEHRVAVQRLADGKTVFAWLYRAKPNRGEREDVWPTAEYKQKILEAALFWKFPRDYVQQIKSWKTR